MGMNDFQVISIDIMLLLEFRNLIRCQMGLDDEQYF